MATSTRALISPQADFWLLGGFSLVVPISLGLLFPHWNVNMTLQQYGWAFAAPMIFNAPHFMFSYQIFYAGLMRRLRNRDLAFFSRLRMAIAGFIAPLVLAVYFTFAFMTHSMQMMGAIINAMLLLSAWHYARQGYGALITGSAYRNIFYCPKQKFILNANTYLMPVLAWVMFNTSRRTTMFFDIPYAGIHLPRELVTALMVPSWIFVLLSVLVLLRNWLIEKRGLPLNGVVGYACATYLWLGLMIISPNFYFLVPIFHALQYFPFIYKYKKIETANRQGIEPSQVWKSRKAAVSMIVFALTGVALGAVFMNFLPKMIDHYTTVPHGFTKNFFLISFLLFINIHHFFIDYAFWRRDNKDVQQFLFRA